MMNGIKAVTTTSNVGSALMGLLGISGNIEAVRVERRAEDESTLNVSEGLLSSPIAVSGAATKTPLDCVVLSLRTSTPGPKGRGRCYWPALAAGLTTSFQLSSPTPAAVVGGAKVWMQSINSAMDDVYIAQSSALRVALSVRSVTDHVCRDVTSIQVGSVLDTQRRRRDDLPESYSTVAYP
jgi:hypothetical protein